MTQPYAWSEASRAYRRADLRLPNLSLLLALSLVCVIFLICGFAWAQPPAAPTAEDAATTQKAFEQLRDRLTETEVKDPQAAIVEYKTFFEQRGFRQAEVAVKISSLIAQIYLQSLKNKVKALEIYEWAIGQYGGFPFGERLIKERDLIMQSKILIPDHTTALAMRNPQHSVLDQVTLVEPAKSQSPDMAPVTIRLPEMALPKLPMPIQVTIKPPLADTPILVEPVRITCSADLITPLPGNGVSPVAIQIPQTANTIPEIASPVRIAPLVPAPFRSAMAPDQIDTPQPKPASQPGPDPVQIRLSAPIATSQGNIPEAVHIGNQQPVTPAFHFPDNDFHIFQLVKPDSGLVAQVVIHPPESTTASKANLVKPVQVSVDAAPGPGIVKSVQMGASQSSSTNPPVVAEVQVRPPAIEPLRILVAPVRPINSNPLESTALVDRVQITDSLFNDVHNPAAVVPPQLFPVKSVLSASAEPVSIRSFTVGNRSDVSTVSDRTIVVAGVMAQLRSGKMTAAQAWQQGLVSMDDLIHLLTNSSLISFTKDDSDTRNALAALVVHHSEDVTQVISTGDSNLKLSIADYYASQKNNEAIHIYELILHDLDFTKSKSQRSKISLVPLALSNLVDYYKNTGDFRKAAETRLRTVDYTDSPEFIANSVLGAARLYLAAGEVSKATELYQKVSNYGYGWASGMALYDQAQLLMTMGKHEDARTLLEKKVIGQYSDQVRVLNLSLTGQSYYQTGDWTLAKQYLNEAVTAYKKIPQPLDGEGLQTSVSIAAAVLRDIEAFNKQPIIISPVSLKLRASSKPSNSLPLVVTIVVRTFRPIKIQITCDSDLVNTELDNTVFDKNAFDVIRECRIKFLINKMGPQKTLDGSLHISSAQFPDLVVTVPFHVEVKPTVMLDTID